MAEDVEYIDVQPAPDSEISVSTGPVVPRDEAYKAKGAGAQSEENDSNPKSDDKSDSKSDKSTTTVAGDKK
jgi:hypothetical protein